MTRDEAIKEARACVRDGCEYASADLVRGLLEAYDEARADVVRLARERDEARAELDHMRQGYDRLRADRDYHCDRAIAAVSERDALAAQLAALREAVRSMREKHDAELEDWALTAGGQRNDRLAAERERNEAIARAERAEAALAALREAAVKYVAIDDAEAAEYGTADIPARPGSPRWRIDRAIANTEAAVEAHDRRVRAEALREAADAYSEEDDGEPRGTRVTAKWLRARADEHERGER